MSRIVLPILAGLSEGVVGLLVSVCASEGLGDVSREKRWCCVMVNFERSIQQLLCNVMKQDK